MVRGLLVLQLLKEVVQDAPDLRHVRGERAGGRIFAKAVLEHVAQKVLVRGGNGRRHVPHDTRAPGRRRVTAPASYWAVSVSIQLKAVSLVSCDARERSDLPGRASRGDGRGRRLPAVDPVPAAAPLGIAQVDFTARSCVDCSMCGRA